MGKRRPENSQSITPQAPGQLASPARHNRKRWGLHAAHHALLGVRALTTVAICCIFISATLRQKDMQTLAIKLDQTSIWLFSCGVSNPLLLSLRTAHMVCTMSSQSAAHGWKHLPAVFSSKERAWWAEIFVQQLAVTAWDQKEPFAVTGTHSGRTCRT